MDSMKFYNRGEELETLERAFSRDRMFAVIYGRRRVGKTRLMIEFFRRIGVKPAYFFVNPKKKDFQLIEEFSQILRDLGMPEYFRPKTWEELFEVALRNYPVFIDEFQNFLKVDESVPFIIQKITDSLDSYKLFISGSSIGLIKKLFVEENAPLRGRATLKINLEPLSPSSIFEILEDKGIKDFEEKLKIYGTFGGIPRHYIFLEQGMGLDSMVKELVLRKDAPLEKEVKEEVEDEFGRRAPTVFAILEAIAKGLTKPSEIANYAGINASSLSPYLYDLVEILGVVRREHPILSSYKEKKSRYYLNDPFYRFWFRFYRPIESYIEFEAYDYAFERYRKEFPLFFSFSFEEIAKKAMAAVFRGYKIGRQWGKHREYGPYEIDAAALSPDKKELIVAEVKWHDKKIGKKELNELMEKASLLNFEGRMKYLLIGKKVEKISEENVLTWDLSRLEEIFRTGKSIY